MFASRSLACPEAEFGRALQLGLKAALAGCGFSIYVIEWAILTSTSVRADSLVWSLFVKRRLYGGAKTTKLARMVDLAFSAPGAKRDD